MQLTAETANFTRARAYSLVSMAPFGQQFRHVLRSLARTPMFTIVTLITIGLGIGANTAIFSMVNGILLKPLPYPHPMSW